MTSNVRRRARLCVPLLFLLLIGAGDEPAARAAQPLLAHGNDDRYWLVQGQAQAGEKGTDDESLIYRRGAGDEKWVLATRLTTGVAALNSRSTQLAVLLNDGAWRLVSDESSTTGPVLPGGAQIVALGNDGENLWAIGRLPATRETGTEAVPATGPTTTAAPEGGSAPTTERPAETESTPAPKDAADGNAAPPTEQPPEAESTPAPERSTDGKPAPATGNTPGDSTPSTIPPGGKQAPEPEKVSPAPAPEGSPEVEAGAAETAPNVELAPAPAPDQPSAPQTAPGGGTLSLYVLTPVGWRSGAALPAAVRPDDAALSLSFIDDEPVVAWRQSPRTIQVYRFVANKTWETAARVETKFDVVRFKLLSGTPRPVLWAVGPGGKAAFFWIERAGLRRVDLPAPAANRPQDMAAAYAAGRVRALWYENGKLVEQTYDPLTGAGGGAAVAVPLPRTPVTPMFMRWVEPAVMLALIFTIVASVRRRQQMRDLVLDPSALSLAPVGRRLLAGIIDALPLLIPLGLFSSGPLFDKGAEAGPGEFSKTQYIVLFAALGVYLAHTIAGEILVGRSLGKLICGLKVVGLDGGRAPASAVLVRNVLRIIDLAMVFFPLLLILFSPLRQRAGDVAAGTLVVLNTRPETAPLEPSSSTAPDAKE